MHQKQSAPYPAISLVNAKLQIFNVVIIQPNRPTIHLDDAGARQLHVHCSSFIYNAKQTNWSKIKTQKKTKKKHEKYKNRNSMNQGTTHASRKNSNTKATPVYTFQILNAIQLQFMKVRK